MARTIVITGANRGLGLEFVKQLISDPAKSRATIFATCRNPQQASDLQQLAKSAKDCRVHVEKLDVGKEEDVKAFAKRVAEVVESDGLNLLINNSGVFDKQNGTLGVQTEESLLEHFRINTVAPILLTRELMPLLKTASDKNSTLPMSSARAAVVNISTKMGSIADNTSGNSYQYRISKSALNMATKCISFDLKKIGVLTILLHPGWVRTDMGGPSGLIDTTQSVQGMLEVIRNATDSNELVMKTYSGEVVPW